MEPENTPGWFSGVYMKLPIFLANQPKHYKNKHLLDLPHTVLNTMPRDLKQDQILSKQKNTHVWGSHHGFLGNLQFNTSKWICKSSGANFSFDWWICHSWNDAIPQLWKKTVRFEISHKTGLRWSFVSLFLVVWFCSEVSLSSLVCRTGLHPTLPGPGLPSQFLHHNDKIHRYQTTSPSPGGSPGPGSGMPPVKSSTSPEATSGKPATNIPAKPAK